MASFQRMRRLAVGGLAIVGGATAAVFALNRTTWTSKQLLQVEAAEKRAIPQYPPLPTREEQLKALRETPEFDILVIGGGATGCGVALDAVSRGLRTAVIEKDDFSSGTSSRSTKLIHGGVRYLQKAILGLDYEQYKLVKEALHERANLLAIAPHLSAPLPIMLPIYKWWQLPYFWVGIKAYDVVAGKQCLKSSYFLSKSKSLELFPMLKKDALVGALVYYDGRHNDARMNLAIALTAIRLGANMANHTEVLELLKTKAEDGREIVCGAKVRDVMTGQEFNIKAKAVVNATGPFTDSIRQMADSTTKKICQPSAGVHVVLPGYYSPEAMGLLDPATKDGRVIFFLPWENKTLAGTTDTPCKVTDSPSPTEEEIQFILEEIKHYLSPDVQVRRGDVLAAWSGIRPLVTDPKAKNTESLSRNHVIDVSSTNLITIAGGKWTTYRSMALDTVDAAVKACNLQTTSESQTDGMLLDGAAGWTPTMFIRLAQDFGLESEVAEHLANTYGDHAFEVARLAELTGKRHPVVGVRLAEEFPYLEAEVKYAVKEYACTAVDVLARRTRLAFLNAQAAEEVVPRVVELMAKELGWNKQRQKEEREKAIAFIYEQMGSSCRENLMRIPINFDESEIKTYTKKFDGLDTEKKGFITSVDIRKYLDLMSALRTGAVSHSRLGTAIELGEQKERVVISTERSGGGV
ncbi:glycerol-3-phosphate dehydrogenase, mitochondrial-like isoform X2 [Ptychodera flava]|uniref:glycerol-3-phosphate dehydrogenase, mitochondrial-like isoform X2 n=1 Tax=Ptychodera flava TaxID=63121 RepID=UPI00396A1AA6